MIFDYVLYISKTNAQVFSVEDIISNLLANDNTMEKLQYRANYHENDLEANRQNQMMMDYFDGSAYQELVDAGEFANKNDIACSIYTDGFVNTKRGKEKYTMIHMVLLNFDPQTRYKQTYHIQLGIVASDSKICLDSFLCPILAELSYLSRFGMTLKKSGQSSVEEFAKSSLAAEHPVNKRFGQYLPSTSGPVFLRSKESYTTGDCTHGIQGVSLLSQMSTFHGPTFYAKDKFHTVARGVGLLVDITGETKFYQKTSPTEQHYNKANYPFLIPKETLLDIGERVDKPRQFVPISFSEFFLKDLITTRQNSRAVEVCDYFLQIVPLFVPELESHEARIALLELTRGCSIALSWTVSTSDLVEMGSHFKTFFDFCNAQIATENLSKAVFTPMLHYLTHIADTIKIPGPMLIYSRRSLERSIGYFKTLMTAKINDQAQPSNLVEKVMRRSLLSHSLDVEQAANLIRPPVEDSSDWCEHDQDAEDTASNRQL
ncbi:hypothetical protein MBANPS3_012280 [Mucor bainieri]